jgi:hypothetical protein
VAELGLRWAPEGDGTGRVLARVEASGYAGHGEGWFHLHEVALFCERLLAYPLDANVLPALVGSSERHPFSVSVVPHDRRGTLRVAADLTARGDDERMPDLHVRAAFLVGYNDVQAFANALRSILAAAADAPDEAVLPDTAS